MKLYLYRSRDRWHALERTPHADLIKVLPVSRHMPEHVAAAYVTAHYGRDVEWEVVS